MTEMLSKLIYIFLLVAIAGCVRYVQPRLNDDSPFSLLSLVKIEAHYVKTMYTVIAQTRSYPGKLIKKEDGHVYEIHLTLLVGKDLHEWDQPFYLQVENKDGKIENYKFNADGTILSSGTMYDFDCLFETKRKGEVRVTLGYLQDRELFFDRENRFRSGFVLLE